MQLVKHVKHSWAIALSRAQKSVLIISTPTDSTTVDPGPHLKHAVQGSDFQIFFIKIYTKKYI